MSPAKALELVMRYARLTKFIKSKTAEIGENLDKCKGISGKRGELDPNGCWITPPDLDGKGRDKDLHLLTWYTPDMQGDGYYQEIVAVYDPIGNEHAEQCPYCYAAHLAIQDRKQARKQLAAVKGAMSRSAA